LTGVLRGSILVRPALLLWITRSAVLPIASSMEP
jgi:hypothetical protein